MSRGHSILVIGLAACTLLLSGCMNVVGNTDGGVSTGLPDITPGTQKAVYGESSGAISRRVSLYDLSGGNDAFSTTDRIINVSGTGDHTGSIVESVIDLFLSLRKNSPGLEELHLLGIEQSNGILSVDLSAELLMISEQNRYALVVALADSLLSLNDINAVNILCSGSALSAHSLPIGVQTTIITNLTAGYAQYGAEKEYFLEDASGGISRGVLLYLPSTDGRFLVPVYTSTTFEHRDTFFGELFDLLCDPSTCSVGGATALNGTGNLLNSQPYTAITDNGKRVLSIDLSGASLNEQLQRGLERWQIYGALCMTAQSFFADLDAVRLTLDGTPVSELRIDDRDVIHEDGLLDRHCFSSRIGTEVPIFRIDPDAQILAYSTQVMPLLSARSVSRVLSQVLDSDALPITGVSSADLLGISVEDQTACVNLSADFYRRAQGISESEERLAIYAMVNTLCSLPDITSVCFRIDGCNAQTLAGSIYIVNPLFPSEGLLGCKSITEVHT